VLDRVVSSYTPTLRALLEARAEESSSAARDRDRMLIVALAQTPGQVSLPNVARERQLLSQLFRDNHTILADHDASWESVREQLPRHGWVHFSCHGDQNLADPSHGGIMLHDRPLTIAEISDGQYHGDFAFLSACKTATGGVTLPDEAITLAAALHYTGYRHVIGTLWSIRDRTAAAVTEAVYTDLTSSGTFEPGRAATALHIAVRRLRDAGRPLSQWVPFTHTGP
jgi:CHAT domain-containing protein